VAEPLIRLTKKDVHFVWLKDQGWDLEEMVRRFTTAAMIQHIDQQRMVVIEADTSDYVSA